MKTVTVSAKSQIVIPCPIREAPGIQPGQKVQVVLYGNRIELIPLKPLYKLKKRDVKAKDFLRPHSPGGAKYGFTSGGGRTDNGYISRELTDGMVAGVPQRAVLDGKKLWVVPIVLTKKPGGYGEIGAILIDDQTHSILGRSKILQ